MACGGVLGTVPDEAAGAWLDTENPELTEWYGDARTGQIDVIRAQKAEQDALEAVEHEALEQANREAIEASDHEAIEAPEPPQPEATDGELPKE